MSSWDQVVLALLALLLTVPGTIVSILAIYDWREKHRQKKGRQKKRH